LGSTNSPFCFAKNGSKTLTFLSGDVQFKNFEIDFHEKQIFDQVKEESLKYWKNEFKLTDDSDIEYLSTIASNVNELKKLEQEKMKELLSKVSLITKIKIINALK
jgi:hypothetical protein